MLTEKEAEAQGLKYGKDYVFLSNVKSIIAVIGKNEP